MTVDSGLTRDAIVLALTTFCKTAKPAEEYINIVDYKCLIVQTFHAVAQLKLAYPQTSTSYNQLEESCRTLVDAGIGTLQQAMVNGKECTGHVQSVINAAKKREAEFEELAKKFKRPRNPIDVQQRASELKFTEVSLLPTQRQADEFVNLQNSSGRAFPQLELGHPILFDKHQKFFVYDDQKKPKKDSTDEVTNVLGEDGTLVVTTRLDKVPEEKLPVTTAATLACRYMVLCALGNKLRPEHCMNAIFGLVAIAAKRGGSQFKKYFADLIEKQKDKGINYAPGNQESNPFQTNRELLLEIACDEKLQKSSSSSGGGGSGSGGQGSGGGKGQGQGRGNQGGQTGGFGGQQQGWKGLYGNNFGNFGSGHGNNFGGGQGFGGGFGGGKGSGGKGKPNFSRPGYWTTRNGQPWYEYTDQQQQPRLQEHQKRNYQPQDNNQNSRNQRQKKGENNSEEPE